MIRESAGKKHAEEIGRRQFMKAAGMATISGYGNAGMYQPVVANNAVSYAVGHAIAHAPSQRREPLPRSTAWWSRLTRTRRRPSTKRWTLTEGCPISSGAGTGCWSRRTSRSRKRSRPAPPTIPTCSPDIASRREAGASEVIVVDHTIDSPKLCLDYSGVKAAAERAGSVPSASMIRENMSSGPSSAATWGASR